MNKRLFAILIVFFICWLAGAQVASADLTITSPAAEDIWSAGTVYENEAWLGTVYEAPCYDVHWNLDADPGTEVKIEYKIAAGEYQEIDPGIIKTNKGWYSCYLPASALALFDTVYECTVRVSTVGLDPAQSDEVVFIIRKKSPAIPVWVEGEVEKAGGPDLSGKEVFVHRGTSYDGPYAKTTMYLFDGDNQGYFIVDVSTLPLPADVATYFGQFYYAEIRAQEYEDNWGANPSETQIASLQEASGFPNLVAAENAGLKLAISLPQVIPNGMASKSFPGPGVESWCSAIGGYGSYKFFPQGNWVPWLTSLTPDGDFSDGEIAGMPEADNVGSYDVTITLKDSAQPENIDLKSYAFQIFPALDITSTNDDLPSAIEGGQYFTEEEPLQLAAVGGSGNYAWSITNKAVELDWLQITESGGLYGIVGEPILPAAYSFTVKVVDTGLPNLIDAYIEKEFQITIVHGFVVSPDPPPPFAHAVKGQVYLPEVDGIEINVFGGSGDYTYSLEEGTMPQGMEDVSDGRINGTPTEDGAYTFNLKVHDNDSGADIYTGNLTLIVDPYEVAEGTVPLLIERDGDDLKVTWNEEAYDPPPVFFYQVGDGSGQYVNEFFVDDVQQWLTKGSEDLVLPEEEIDESQKDDGIVRILNQVGQGQAEIYVKAMDVNAVPTEKVPLATAVGKLDIALPSNIQYQTLHVISVPFEPLEEDINSVIGVQVAADGGGTGFDDADYIYYLEPGEAAPQAFFTGAGWQGTLNKVEVDKGYVVVIQASHPAWNLTLVGKVPTENRSITLKKIGLAGLNLFGTAYPVPVSLQPIDETGLSVMGPKAGTGFDNADNIYTFNPPQAAPQAFFNNGQAWSGTLNKLVPGKGYVYIKQDDGSKVWDYPKPY